MCSRVANKASHGMPVWDTRGDEGENDVGLLSPDPRDTFQGLAPPSIPRLPVEGLGLDNGGNRFSGMSLGWLQPGPARANQGGLYAQTLTRSRGRTVGKSCAW